MLMCLFSLCKGEVTLQTTPDLLSERRVRLGLGVHTVTATVTDESFNTAQCTFQVEGTRV